MPLAIRAASIEDHATASSAAEPLLEEIRGNMTEEDYFLINGAAIVVQLNRSMYGNRVGVERTGGSDRIDVHEIIEDP